MRRYRKYWHNIKMHLISYSLRLPLPGDFGRSRRLRRRESRRRLRPVPCPGALRRNKALDPMSLACMCLRHPQASRHGSAPRLDMKAYERDSAKNG